MTIGELVGGSVISVRPAQTLSQAAQTMVSLEVGSVAVMVDGALEGILTERDLLGALARGVDCDEELVSSWMSPLPETFHPDQSVMEAANWMLATGYRHLPVLDDDGAVLGIVSIKDVLWATTDIEVG